VGRADDPDRRNISTPGDYDLEQMRARLGAGADKAGKAACEGR